MFLFAGVRFAVAASPVFVDAQLKQKVISSNMDYLEDPRGTLGIDAVAAQDTRWQANNKASLAFGFTHSAYWFRFKLRFDEGLRQKILLELDYPLLDNVTLFVPRPDGGFDTIKTGDHLPFYGRQIVHRYFVFPLTPHEGETTYYMRVRTESSLHFKAVLWSQVEFVKQLNETLPVLWLFYGIMMAIAIYNFLIFLSIKDPGYLSLVSFILFISLLQFALNGFAFQYLWPNWIWWANVCIPIFLCLAMIAGMYSVRMLFGVWMASDRRFKIMTRACVIPLSVCTLFSLVGPYSISMRLTIYLSILTIVTMIAMMAMAFRFGERRAVRLAWRASAGSMSAIVGGGAYALMALGVLPVNFLSTYGFQIGNVLMVFFMSFAFADRFTYMKDAVDTGTQIYDILNPTTKLI